MCKTCPFLLAIENGETIFAQKETSYFYYQGREHVEERVSN